MDSWPACLTVLPAFISPLQMVLSPLPGKLFSTLLLLDKLLLTLQGSAQVPLLWKVLSNSHPGMCAFLPMLSQNPAAAYLRKTPALPHDVSIILFTRETSVLRRLSSVGHDNGASSP